MAYHSKADILFYGGAAGGGKTDLLLGLAHTAHHKTLIFRREFPQLKGIEDRANELFGSAKRKLGDYNRSEKFWNFYDGRVIEFGAVQHLDSKEKYQGRPHDLKGFDEITHFHKEQFLFLIAWNRSAIPDQRCRVVCTGNPPTNAEGDWVIEFWAPWLDDKHPNPAKPGELRYFTTIDGKDIEVADSSPFMHKGEIVTPKSRTFIPAKIEDNPYLINSGYKDTLQALPEPLRSKMLKGDFSAGREDNARQLIPSEWVRLAQERWKNRRKPERPPEAIGIDVARGGRDKTVISPRIGNYFCEQVCLPGIETPDGISVVRATLPLLHNSETHINVDIIGIGTSPYDSFKMHGFKNVFAMNAAEGSEQTDRSGLLAFANKRAEWWWKFREALDPETGLELAIPDDRELLADLCAPLWEVTARGIIIESKDEIKTRIMRSPDKGDSIVMALAICEDSTVFGSVSTRN